MSTKQVESPRGDLEWVLITGEGTASMSGVMQYKASLVLEGAQAETFKALLDDYWEEEHPKGIKIAKSMGYYPHTERTDEIDPDTDKPVYKETGKTLFVFKTGVKFPDGKPKVVTIFNAKGAEVSIGDKKIGNGSRGRIKGAIGIYTVLNPQTKKVIQGGVTLYLNAIQLSKFVEFKSGTNFDALEDEDGDGFEGVGDMGGIEEESTTEASETSKPRL